MTADGSPVREREEQRRTVLESYQRGRKARLAGDFPGAFRELLLATRALTAVQVDSRSRALLFTEIGLTFKYWGEPGRSLHWYRLALDLLAPGDPLAPDVEHNIGGALHAMGDVSAAEPHARRALALRRESHHQDRDSVAADEVALAAILVSAGRPAEAERLLIAAQRHFQRTCRGESAEAASALHNLAAIEVRRGRLAQAEAYQRRCLAIQKAIHGEGSPYALTAWANLGRIHLLSGRPAAARKAFAVANAILAFVSPVHPVAQRVRDGMARTSC